MLISALVGVDMRATMDMDATIKGFHLKQEKLEEIVNEIISINLEDNILMSLINIKDIREEDEYNGYKVTLESNFDGIKVPIKIDITTGDVITPREIRYKFDLMFEDRTIDILAYNIETVISEKFETVITRGVDNTRSRDFYDLYILLNFQKSNINLDILRQAILNKFESRKTIKKLEDIENIFSEIKNSENLKRLWKNYCKNYSYAEDITYEEVIIILEDIMNYLKVL